MKEKNLSVVNKVKGVYNQNRTIIQRVIFGVCLIVLVYSLYMCVSIFLDYYNSDKLYDKMAQMYDTEVGEGLTAGEITTSPTRTPQLSPTPEGQILDPNATPTPKPTPVTEIPRADFNELKKFNKDIVGWLKIDGTRINYPIVQTYDNDYYIKHTIDKKVRRPGTIFVDYRNDIKKLNANTILYGHNMRDGSMFDNLRYYKQKGFFDTYKEIEFDTLYKQYKWEVFSVYVTDVKFNYLKTKFATDKEYLDFLNTIRNKSIFKTNIKFTKDDKILTLSTCSYEFDNARTVVHARLKKK